MKKDKDEVKKNTVSALMPQPLIVTLMQTLKLDVMINHLKRNSACIFYLLKCTKNVLKSCLGNTW